MRSKSGFSLIAVALVVVVIGAAVLLLLVPLSATQFDKVQQTTQKLTRIRAALGTYYRTHNAVYPCPAAFTKNISDTEFGTQVSTKCQAGFAKCSTVTADGVYTEGTDFFCSSPASFNSSWIGGVPVREIGLSDDYTFDGWGNRFTYAINNDVFHNGSSIIVQTYYGGSVIANPPIHVLSYGPDGKGAFTRLGTRRTDCPLTGGERNNCMFGTNTFIYGVVSNTDYDDISFDYNN